MKTTSDGNPTDKDPFCLRCGVSVFVVARGDEPKRTGMDWIMHPCKKKHVWGGGAEAFLSQVKMQAGA